MSVYFRTFENKTADDPDKISGRNISIFINKLLGRLL
jgi:hypothetical protein